MYNPNQPNFGNSNFGLQNIHSTISWGLTYHSNVDLRLFYTGLLATSWSRCRWAPTDTSIPNFYRISPYTHRQICYTPEALLYAQSAYFLAAILVQVANNIISRTRYLSFAEHGLSNHWGNLSFLFELAIGLIIVYIPFIQRAISTRPVAIPHFMIPAFTFGILILLYDEIRKLFVRRGIKRTSTPEGTIIKYDGWVARNTYY